MKTPILFLIFKRPDTTRRVFEMIKKVKPEELFIAADGPRKNKPGEEKKCMDTRRIVKEINWKCEVKRLYRSENLGCERAVESAISWFFKYVDAGIILEDDCLPSKSFFSFCETMLEKYKNNPDVVQIAGTSYVPLDLRKIKGYFFSKYLDIWGWATWKRAWKYYDGSMEEWPYVKKEKDFNSLFTSVWEKLYWHIIFDATYNGKTNSWGYKWLYSVWLRKGKSIAPTINLVKNIGIGGDLTHVSTNKKRLIMETDFELDDPSKLKLLGNSFSKKVEQYIIKKIKRISPLMDLAQFLYYKSTFLNKLSEKIIQLRV